MSRSKIFVVFSHFFLLSSFPSLSHTRTHTFSHFFPTWLPSFVTAVPYSSMSSHLQLIGDFYHSYHDYYRFVLLKALISCKRSLPAYVLLFSHQVLGCFCSDISFNISKINKVYKIFHSRDMVLTMVLQKFCIRRWNVLIRWILFAGLLSSWGYIQKQRFSNQNLAFEYAFVFSNLHLTPDQGHKVYSVSSLRLLITVAVRFIEI